MSPPPARTTVSAEDLRALCLVRAFEESDPDGRVLSALERRRTSPGVDAGSAPGAALAARAHELLALLEQRVQGAGTLLAASGAGVPALLLVTLALVAGLATNLLAERHVSVLAFPLCGALLWNLVVYLGLAWGALRPAPARPRGARPNGLVLRAVQALLASRARRALFGTGREAAAVSVPAAVRFAHLYMDSARSLLAARARRALHLGAATLAFGMVAGMYLRGLVVEYRATWESTFLGDAAAEALVGLVLAPARALSGIAMPPLAPLRWPESGEAAPWIHLWAWTALLFVIAPRTLLWLIETARVARLSRALPLDLEAPYYRRLLAAQGGAGQHVEVAAYAGTLGPRAYERLRELLHDLLGARAEVTQRAAVEYGTEAESLAPAREDACLVLVFALAQTPELEVQVRLLEELRASLRPGQRLLVVVDSAGYLERLGAGEEARARLAERRRAWDRATRETQLAVLHLDLGSAPDDDALVRAGEALWTAGGRRA